MFKFTDGTSVYQHFDKEYKRHEKGYVILGPSGMGKTTYIRSQKEKNWIDSDDLLGQLGVNWHHNEDDNVQFKLNYMRADYMLEQSKQYGYRILGALFWDYKADAMVIPDYEQHKKYMAQRTDLDLSKINDIRQIYFGHAMKHDIPIFGTIEEAVNYLENLV